jgi:prolyl-tRNA synthetase
MMGDGKALQMATSHELGQNFARAFDITYTDADGAVQHAWTTSWGSSTRMIGGLIMAHGDDRGLRIPPRIAPIQVAVVVVRDEDGAGDYAQALVTELQANDVRAKLDANVHIGFGRRATDWEIKGVPVRIDVGPRDLKQGEVTLVRRDAGPLTVPAAGVAASAAELLQTIQDSMLEDAMRFRDASVSDATTISEAAEAAQAGVARIAWDRVGPDGERTLLDRGVSVRCLQREDGSIPQSDDEAGLVAIVARAY